MGLAVVSVAAWLAWLTRTGMTGAAILTALVTISAVVARFAWQRRAEPMERPSNFDWAIGALAVIACALAAYTGPWMGQSADPFYHMAAAQALLRENRAIPQDVFFGITMPYPDVTSGTLELVLAWISLVAGLVPTWGAFTFFGAAFTSACLAALAKEITRSTTAALIAAMLYLVVGLALDMRSAGYPNRIAPGLVWLSFVFLLRFARSDSRPWHELVPVGLFAFAAASIHSGMAPLLVILVISTFVAAALAALWRRRPRTLIPLAIACSALMLLVLPLLVIRVLAAVPPHSPEASLATWAPPLNVRHVLGLTFIDPRFWFSGWVTVTSVGTLCLLGRARRLLFDGDPGAAVLWGGSLIVPAITTVPLVVSVSNQLYFFARVAQLLVPLLLIAIAWELSRLPGLTRISGLAPKSYTLRRMVAGYLLAASMFWIIGDQLPKGVLYRYQGHAAYSVNYSRAHNLTVLWADRLRALDRAGPGAILAGLESSYELAGLTGRRVVAVPFGHNSFQDEARDGPLRRRDVADALRPSPDPTALVSVLYRYQVTFVIVDKAREAQASWDWIAGQDVLTPVAQGSDWKLYRFDPGSLDHVLDVPLKGDVGVFPTRLIAGRAMFVRVKSPGPGQTAKVTALGVSSGATYRTQFALPDQAGSTVTAPLLLPDSARVDRYTVTVTVPGITPVVAGQVDVGHAYDAELFAGVYFGLVHGYARQAGWEAIDNPAYGGGGAARALRAGVPATRPLSEPPGDFCMSLLVFDNGDGRAQALEVRVGGGAVTETWSGAVQAVRDIEVSVHAGASPHQISFRVPARSPTGVIVDRITLYPLAPGTCGAGAPST